MSKTNKAYQVCGREIEPGHRWFDVVAAQGDEPAEILVFDVIDDFMGLSASDFRREIMAVDADKINLRINSPGGLVSDGTAIFNAIREHPAEITAIVEGRAYSVASYIAMAADRVEMQDNSMMMLHAPWVFAAGNADDMREIAEHLDKTAELMAVAYAERMGMTAAEALAFINEKDQYLTPPEAVEKGLADAIRTSNGGGEKFEAAAMDLGGTAPGRVAAMLRERADNMAEIEAEQTEAVEPVAQEATEEVTEVDGAAGDEAEPKTVVAEPVLMATASDVVKMCAEARIDEMAVHLVDREWSHDEARAEIDRRADIKQRAKAAGIGSMAVKLVDLNMSGDEVGGLLTDLIAALDEKDGGSAVVDEADAAEATRKAKVEAAIKLTTPKGLRK